MQKQILRLIARLQREHGTAILFVTHDLGVVAKICDSVTVLYAGKVVEEGRHGRSCFAAPQHPYTRALMAAAPRYDRPDAGAEAGAEAVLAGLRAEIAASTDVEAQPHG